MIAIRSLSRLLKLWLALVVFSGGLAAQQPANANGFRTEFVSGLPGDAAAVLDLPAGEALASRRLATPRSLEACEFAAKAIARNLSPKALSDRARDSLYALDQLLPLPERPGFSARFTPEGAIQYFAPGALSREDAAKYPPVPPGFKIDAVAYRESREDWSVIVVVSRRQVYLAALPSGRARATGRPAMMDSVSQAARRFLSHPEEVAAAVKGGVWENAPFGLRGRARGGPAPWWNHLRWYTDGLGVLVEAPNGPESASDRLAGYADLRDWF